MHITVRFYRLQAAMVERQLEVDADATVAALRERLDEELRLLGGITAPIRAVVHAGRSMEEGRTLADYRVGDGSVVHVPLRSPPVELSVATDWGVVVLSVPAHTALSTVRQELADTHNIDTSGLALLCGGEPLDDDERLSAMNVGGSATLTLARVP
jgi:ubiquitin C